MATALPDTGWGLENTCCCPGTVKFSWLSLKKRHQSLCSDDFVFRASSVLIVSFFSLPNAHAENCSEPHDGWCFFGGSESCKGQPAVAMINWCAVFRPTI